MRPVRTISQKLDIHTDKVNNIIKSIKKDYGIFFTPEWVVNLMVGLINKKIKNKALILEPACGIAQFLMGIKRNNPTFYNNSLKYGVEINEKITEYIEKEGLAKDTEIIYSDYLLWKTNLLFDVIIGNPPYGIPSLSEHYTIKVDNETKQKYRSIFTTWFGKYNVYGAFIEKSIELLKENGQLIFIVPATFMILDEFKRLRKYLAQKGKTQIIYMGPNIFKPEVGVTTIILNFIKSKKLNNKLILSEYVHKKIKNISEEEKWYGEVFLFKTSFSKILESLCSHRLGDIYDIRISPRTPEIKHNPHVKKEINVKDSNYLPILNGRNLKCNEILYKPITNRWIEKNKISTLREFLLKPRIVVGLGFRKGGRVGAAYDKKCYPWMGDVYHLLRKESIITINYDLTDDNVVEYLNSDMIKRYIKDIYREITYHLSITQLKTIPLPRKNEFEKIKRGVT